MAKITCDSCQRKISFPSSRDGDLIDCPSCGEAVLLMGEADLPSDPRFESRRRPPHAPVLSGSVVL